ncbi:hypothetical protein [Tychonema sp. LEGE 07203]|uniref:hypothetical protein n=1 Tax=Tychonema sp. LEGE 07203 TaxID=1828671 RepID=UPI0018804CA1|nr:hypothetical protein [Tychonema sp. LEGE 07203]MBE9094760.1 hypothetical protein [Tychonema sp. LEGE 07203]
MSKQFSIGKSSQIRVTYPLYDSTCNTPKAPIEKEREESEDKGIANSDLVSIV